MRIAGGLLVVACVSCAPSPAESPPPATPPAAYQPQGPSPETVASAQAAARAQYAQVDAQLAAVEADERARAKAKADADAANLAAATAESQRREAEKAAECKATLKERLERYIATAKAWKAFAKRARPHLKTIASRCAIGDTHGVKLSRLPDGAVAVRALSVDDAVQCKGGLPPGLSRQDVVVALNLDEDASIDDDERNADCAAADAANGGALPAITVGKILGQSKP